MYVVIMHESGRVDAESLDDLVRRTAMIYRNGRKPPMYALLQRVTSLPEAATIASRIRSDRRKVNERIEQVSVDEGGQEEATHGHGHQANPDIGPA
jgi:hypothetical protein